MPVNAHAGMRILDYQLWSWMMIRKGESKVELGSKRRGRNRNKKGIRRQAKGEEQKQERNQEASEGGGTETKKESGSKRRGRNRNGGTGTLNVGRSGEGFEVGLKERKAAGGILHF